MNERDSASAIDSRIWRIVGTPLVSGAGSGAVGGALPGLTIAVKDLFQVAGFAVGAGIPDYLAGQDAAARNAAAVQSLLDAGANVTGIARTDEFAYSIAGRNSHYGTPPNAAVRGALPGGSSSGPAAVALGQVDIGLATDTGGSIRVPASYQGLWGLRTTYGAVPIDGVLPLAPSFDTVGWLARDAASLRAAARVSLRGPHRTVEARFVIDPALARVLEPAVDAAFTATVAALESSGTVDALDTVSVGDVDEAFEVFRVVQAFEAWAVHGHWILEHPGALGPEIAARFDAASRVSPAEADAARERLSRIAERLADLLAGRILLLPSASSVAPSIHAATTEIERTRGGTMRLTCVAGIAGRPALSVPGMMVAGEPVGLCLVGPNGTDLALIDHGERIARHLTPDARRTTPDA